MNDSEDVTKVYYADNISPAHQQIVDNFNKRYQGTIEVIPVDLPFTKFTTNERKDLIARTLRSQSSRIDIFAVDQIWVPRFAKWAEPLAQYVPNEFLADMLPYALETCYYDSILVALPLYIDIGLMYYRRDIIDGLPEAADIRRRLKESITWDEFIGVKKQYFPNQPFYVFQGDSYEGLICNFLEILGGNGGSIYEHGEFHVDNLEGRASFGLMSDLIFKYGIAPSEVAGFSENASYLYAIRNDVPFLRGWPSLGNGLDLTKREREKLAQMEMAPLPHFDGHQPSSVFGGWNLMISRFSSQKEAAQTFLAFVLEEESQKLLYEIGSYPPVLNSIYDDSSYTASYPELRFLFNMMGYGIHRPSHPDYTQVSDVLARYLNAGLMGEISVTEALTTAAQRIGTLDVAVE